jgi:hypothetical protein
VLPSGQPFRQDAMEARSEVPPQRLGDLMWGYFFHPARADWVYGKSIGERNGIHWVEFEDGTSYWAYPRS